MTDRKASEVEKARLQLPLHRGVGNDCCRIFERNGRSVATVDTPDIGTVIIDLVNRPAVRAEQQGGHVARCGCCDKAGAMVKDYRDPRCGESIELIKAKARLEALDRVLTLIPSDKFTYTQVAMISAVRDEARAEVEKLGSKA